MCMTFVFGGVRSGKSSFAEQKAKEYGNEVLYIATAVVTDEAMAKRVQKHQEQRPSSWKTLESYKGFENLKNNNDFLSSNVVMIDCITTMIGNFMVDSGIDFDHCTQDKIIELEKEIKNNIAELINICNEFNKKLIIVSNEVGLGVVPAYYMGNYFRDISGRMNAFIAKEAYNVYFLIAGIPLKLKSKGVNIKCLEDF